MRVYAITVSGCDDSTTVEMPLTDAGAEALLRAAEAITEASEYPCMPKMRVEAKEGAA